MTQALAITTGVRLHFGLLSHRGPSSAATGSGRNFGGVGLMIDAPRFRVSIRRAETDAVRASMAYRERVEQFVATYRSACPPDRTPGPCKIEVLDEIPPHAGLGAGTQLGMAIAQGLA